jgi:hypothetical protein
MSAIPWAASNPGRETNCVEPTSQSPTAPRQPAEPIIVALGWSLPERKVQISEISLVNQRGLARNSAWHLEATIMLGTPP